MEYNARSGEIRLVLHLKVETIVEHSNLFFALGVSILPQ